MFIPLIAYGKIIGFDSFPSSSVHDFEGNTD
jgi:hypothetical protein